MLSWQQKVDLIHRVVVKGWPAYGIEDARFLALALGGEVGEFQNLVKKNWRGDFGTPSLEQDYRDAIKEELADIRIYLELLARAYGVDLDQACQAKIPELLRRWPEAKAKIECAEDFRDPDDDGLPEMDGDRSGT